MTLNASVGQLRLLILASLFAALTAAGAMIKIPVGIVPITLQTFVVYLAGLFLGGWGGCLSQLIYVLMGLIGIPVFSLGGGPAYILSPTFGYLVGFIFAALACGFLTEKGGIVWPLLGIIVAVVIIYACGVFYLYIHLAFIARKAIPLMGVMKIGLFASLPLDSIKATLALGIFYGARKRLRLPTGANNGG